MTTAPKLKPSEVLAWRGEEVARIESEVRASEARLQSEQAAYNKRVDPKATHDAEKHGLSRAKVESLVRPRLTSTAWDFCGKEYAAELWESL